MRILRKEKSKFSDKWFIDRDYNESDPSDIIRIVSRVRYAWPGGYELATVFNNGDCLCSGCTKANYRQLLEDVKFYGKNSSFAPQAFMHGGEIDPGEEFCSDCGKDLSSYDD